MPVNNTPTIGRFAPSPTGPLHFGSLIAAVASYLCAKSNNGKWLLRIEDIDTQREQKGASQSIIKSLEEYGLEWDSDIRFQSKHLDDYEDALSSLDKHTYPCSCTRKSLKAATGTFSPIYPNFCRVKTNNPESEQFSTRLRSDIKVCNQNISFKEFCQHYSFKQDLEKDVGDFILKRSDGLFAYQLAVVVDDHIQGITDIVRGADLFDNTPRQLYLQCLLKYKHPNYLHFPLVVNPDGKKLSKQNLAPQISTIKKRDTLISALMFLGQTPPSASDFSTVNDIWLWAVQNWSPNKIPKTLTQPIPNHYE